MNTLITVDWIWQDSMRQLRNLPRQVGNTVHVRLPQRWQVWPPKPTPVVIPPSVLVAGLALAVAAKVPFSRRRLLMPWKAGEE